MPSTLSIIFSASAFTMVILGLIFTRISVNFIDKELIKNKNIPVPDWDSGIGARAPMYALIILFKIFERRSLFSHASYIRQYARPLDRTLAAIFLGSLFIVVATMLASLIF